MAKANITQYSSTPSSNTDINNINIDENCPASGLNNAIRELMAHLKNVDTGSQALTALSVTGNATVNDGITVTDSGASPIIANRTTSDGTIIDFRKDGSTVGSIGAEGGQVYIVTGDTGLKFASGVDAFIPVNVNGANRDNAIDLGVGSVRFRDIYLSGGIQFDATGEFLDDYEEGSFTPTFGGSGGNQTVSYAFQFGTYVKVGKLVFVNISVGATGTPSGGSGDLIINGLPFTTKSGVQQAGSMAFANSISFGSSGTQGYCNVEGGVTYLNINSQEFVGTSSMSRVPASGIHNVDPRIVCTICYESA